MHFYVFWGSVNSKAIADAIKDEDVSLEAEHIADDGKKESVELTSAAGGEAVFEAESFSIYLIKEHDNNSEDTATPRVFYHFLSQNYTQVEDGEDIYYTAGAYSFPNKYNEMVDTQIIKNGEKLQEVVIPENNDVGMFYGWYRVHLREENNGVYSYDWGTGTPERQEFNTAVTVPTSSDFNNKDQHIYLAPLYGHYRFLTFHQAEEGDPLSNMIIARKLIVLNSQNNADIKISDVRAPSSEPNKIVFWGWKFTHTEEHDPYASQHGNDPTEIVRTVDEDDSEIDASINIRDDHTIEGINNNQSVTFGLHVSHANTQYKFIGWYTTCGAAPNTPTVKGVVNGFGEENINGIAVPLNETTYYALYVPYANDNLNVTHNQKEDSPGPCASGNGLTLSVTYNNDTLTAEGDAADPALCSVAVDESELSPDVNYPIQIKVGALQAAPGAYDATFYNGQSVVGTKNTTTNYYEYTYDLDMKELLTASDSVKGLMKLNDVTFSSAFSLGYVITYRYTARDGRKHDHPRKISQL